MFAVLLSHSGLQVNGNGTIGVDVFFVLSGYLITGILVQEVDATGAVDLRRFYARRVRRLLPAAVVMFTIVTVGASLGVGTNRDVTLRNGWSGMLYIGNWFAARGVDAGMLGHMWSVCVEEQFYLVWPLILVVALRRSRCTAAAVAAAGIACSVALTIWLAHHGASYMTLYFRTDTRAMEPLAGCFAALRMTRVRPTSVLRTCGVGAAAVLAFAALYHSPGEGILNNGGRLGTSILAVAVILLFVHLPASRATRAAGSRLAAGLGRTSYGTYLWTSPIIVSVHSLHQKPRFLLAFPATFGAGWLSERYVERPFYRRATLAGASGCGGGGPP